MILQVMSKNMSVYIFFLLSSSSLVYTSTLLPCAQSWALEVIELYTTQSSLSSWGDASFFAHFLFVLLPVQPKDAVA